MSFAISADFIAAENAKHEAALAEDVAALGEQAARATVSTAPMAGRQTEPILPAVRRNVCRAGRHPRAPEREREVMGMLSRKQKRKQGQNASPLSPSHPRPASVRRMG